MEGKQRRAKELVAEVCGKVGSQSLNGRLTGTKPLKREGIRHMDF